MTSKLKINIQNILLLYSQEMPTLDNNKHNTTAAAVQTKTAFI